MNQKAIEKTELNKILLLASEFSTLDNAKEKLAKFAPKSTALEVKTLLKETAESTVLLFEKGAKSVPYFPAFSDEIERAGKGASLSCAELLHVKALLTSTRETFNEIQTYKTDDMTEIPAYAEKLYFDEGLESEIERIVVSDTAVSDTASDKLYELRSAIRALNEKIRSRLADYLTGDEGKYLQDAIVTMRGDRYVLPVRAEYKRSVKGFIHDKSASGATFFIEPEEVLEMNNELKSLSLDEKEEVARILAELSRRVGAMKERLNRDISVLEEIDVCFARAEYGYSIRAILPNVSKNGVIQIKQGRHPLIEKEKVVPITVSLGENYRFLLISGPNTGGKTVTLKMIGLFCLMTACGLFLPVKEATVSVFGEIYCDIGDAQSIEENLSTFSSHIQNIVEIVKRADRHCLVLMDELGGGTDPEEGEALGKAVIEHLLSTGACGVITTHYSGLKEYAFSTDGIENACMEFDAQTLKPLYAVKIGLPGASNALLIARRLGLDEKILETATKYLSLGTQKFEKILQSAEESRVEAEKLKVSVLKKERELIEKLAEAEREKERLEKEKEKVFSGAKAEARRIIRERTETAEEILAEIEEIFARDTLSEGDLIRSRTLKNKLFDQSFEKASDENKSNLAPIKSLKIGQRVYVKSVGNFGEVLSFREEKKEAEVLCGSVKMRVKFADLFVQIGEKIAQTDKVEKKVQIVKKIDKTKAPMLELNVIGRTVVDALMEVENFLDGALLSGLETVRIVHGMGTGKLRAGIHEYLKKQPHVAEFRLGVYGEGDSGVTIVKLK